MIWPDLLQSSLNSIPSSVYSDHSIGINELRSIQTPSSLDISGLPLLRGAFAQTALISFRPRTQTQQHVSRKSVQRHSYHRKDVDRLCSLVLFEHKLLRRWRAVGWSAAAECNRGCIRGPYLKVFFEHLSSLLRGIIVLFA